jgi:hypothetical protein
MKGLLEKFQHNVLSKDEMKGLKGGAGICHSSITGYFSATDIEDARNTVLAICGPCNFTCNWE